MPLTPDNAAARLFLILERLKGVAPSVSVKSAWASVLGASDRGKLLSRMGMVYNLPREIEQQLRQLDDFDPSNMDWWPVMAETFGQQGWGIRWDSVSHALADLGPIRAAARRLHRHRPEPQFPPGTLDELHRCITQVREAMSGESDLDDDLTEFLLGRLDFMEDLLGDVMIVGAVGIYTKLEITIAEVDKRSEVMEEELSPGTWAYWKEMMSRTREVCDTLERSIKVAALGGSLFWGTLQVLPPAPRQLEAPQGSQSESQRQAPPQLEVPQRDIPQLEEKQQAPDADEDDAVDAEFKISDGSGEEAA